MVTQLTPKGAQPASKKIGPCLLWPNSWKHQDKLGPTTWYGGRSRPRRHCVRWRPSSPIQKGGTAPNFRIMSIVAKRLDGSRCNLVSLYTDVGIGPGHTVLDVDPNPAPTKRGTDPQFTAHVCCGQMVAHLSYCGALVELWLIQLQIECLQFLSLVACTLPCTYTRVEARRWKTRKTIYYGRPIWNRAGHYIFALWFLSFFLLSFFLA